MMMSDDEIRLSYTHAANKDEQLSILAELNACSVSKILEILNGVEKKRKRQIYDKNAIAQCINAGMGILETANKLGYDTSTTGFKQTYWKVKKGLELYNKELKSDFVEIQESANSRFSESDLPVVIEDKVPDVKDGMMSLHPAKKDESVLEKPRATPKKIIPKDVNIGLINNTTGVVSTIKNNKPDKGHGIKSGVSELKKSMLKSSSVVEKSKKEALSTTSIDSDAVNLSNNKEKSTVDADSVSLKSVEEHLGKDFGMDSESADTSEGELNENKIVKSEVLDNLSEKELETAMKAVVDKELEKLDSADVSDIPEFSKLSSNLEFNTEILRLKLLEVEAEIEQLKCRHNYLIQARQCYLILLGRRG